MSDLWNARPGQFTAPTLPPPVAFTPWASRLIPGFGIDPADAVDDIVPTPIDIVDPEEIAVGAFARGYEEGCRAMEDELAAERAAVGILANALETLRPEPPASLAALIAETVERLVRDIVGNAGVDVELLLARAEAAAALVVDETRPVRMRLCPDDKRRLADAGLGIELVADPSLMPGSILIETQDGWIEDGPQTALARLRQQLDRMGVAR